MITIKESAIVILGNAFAAVGGLVLIKASTSVMNPGLYGGFALGLTLVGLTNQLWTGGVINGICRFFAIAKEEDDASFFDGVNGVLALSVVVIFFIFLCIYLLFLAVEFSSLNAYLIGFLIIAIVSAYGNSLNAIQNTARLRFASAVHSNLDVWGKIFLIIIISSFLGNSIWSVILAYIVSSLIVTFIRYTNIKKNLEFLTDGRNKNKWQRHIHSFALSFSMMGPFVWLQQSSDKWLLSIYSDGEQVGLYSALYQIGFVPASLAINTVMMIYVPIILQKVGKNASDLSVRKNSRSILWQIFGVSILTSLVFTAILVGISEEIMVTFTNENYRSAASYLPTIFMAGAIFASSQALEYVFQAELQTRKLMKLKILTSLVGLVFNFVLISNFGFSGAVYSQILYSLFSTFATTICIGKTKSLSC